MYQEPLEAEVLRIQSRRLILGEGKIQSVRFSFEALSVFICLLYILIARRLSLKSIKSSSSTPTSVRWFRWSGAFISAFFLSIVKSPFAYLPIRKSR